MCFRTTRTTTRDSTSGPSTTMEEQVDLGVLHPGVMVHPVVTVVTHVTTILATDQAVVTIFSVSILVIDMEGLVLDPMVPLETHMELEGTQLVGIGTHTEEIRMV